MELEGLLSLLEIDSPQDLSYFEQYAELVENPAEIPADALAALFEEVDRETLAELTDGYFEDILKYTPDDAAELYTLLSTIRQTLLGLAVSPDAYDGHQSYADEFVKFRNWFSFDSEVSCTSLAGSEEQVVPVSGALALFRAEHLNEDEYQYDFADALDYHIDEYIIPLNMLDGDDEDDDADDTDDFF
jgi:hypothetical protein